MQTKVMAGRTRLADHLQAGDTGVAQVIVLDASGDLQITWDPENAAEVEQARAAVADLKAKGYSFFLAGGEPADEVTAGGGKLEVRRVEAEEVVDAMAKPVKRHVVAVRPLQGG